MPHQNLSYEPPHRMRPSSVGGGSFCALHPARRQRRNHRLRRLSDAASRAVREHDAAAGSDDLLLRGVARLDRICGGLGDCRGLEAPRRLPGPCRRSRQHADRPRHADLQRGSDSNHLGTASHGRGARTHRGESRLRDRRPLGFDECRCVDSRDGRGRPPAPLTHRHHAGVVSTALAKHRPQGGKCRGIRHALGRALRPYDRARRRQPDRRADAAAIGADDARGPAAGDPADGATAHRCADLFRPAAAVRRVRLRPGHRARSGGVVRRQRQLLGPQRHHSRRGICGELRPARARGPQAVRRPRTLARLRRGGPHAPRRMEGAHDHRLREFLGRVARRR